MYDGAHHGKGKLHRSKPFRKVVISLKDPLFPLLLYFFTYSYLVGFK